MRCAIGSWPPGRPASEFDRLRYGDGAHGSGARRQRVPELPTLLTLAPEGAIVARDQGKEERLAAAKGLWEFVRSVVAEFKDGKLICWTASQATHLLRKQLAVLLAMPEADVRCVHVDSSGCHGRNGHEDAAADAALLAAAVGRPLRVQ